MSKTTDETTPTKAADPAALYTVTAGGCAPRDAA